MMMQTDQEVKKTDLGLLCDSLKEQGISWLRGGDDNEIQIIVGDKVTYFNADGSHMDGVAVRRYEAHGLDTQTQVFFYEQEHYVLSNFSSFQVNIWGHIFPTSEHAYHYAKFPGEPSIQHNILVAKSAHEAFQMAGTYKDYRRKDWDDVKVSVMREILIEKVKQHPYVLQKLLNTGDRALIENSWRDDVWGWGPNKDGQNLLGKLWMELRGHFQHGIEQLGKAA